VCVTAFVAVNFLFAIGPHMSVSQHLFGKPLLCPKLLLPFGSSSPSVNKARQLLECSVFKQ